MLDVSALPPDKVTAVNDGTCSQSNEQGGRERSSNG